MEKETIQYRPKTTVYCWKCNWAMVMEQQPGDLPLLHRCLNAHCANFDKSFDIHFPMLVEQIV